MPNIQINIKEKVARGDGTIIVCGNSDYVAHFDFDSEWDEYTTKTAHFEWGGKYEDRIFTGNECAVPVVYGVNALTIGVFAGDIRSTTPAFFKCVPCSQDSNSIPADPAPDVYNQLMELLNKESGIWYPAVDDAGNMSWTRSMSETEPQPVNIKGPKGDAGADGVGIPGTDGKDGVDGKSAYELAQDNGFQGTMQEWLASLVGADGANGVDGNDGISPAVSVTAITGGNRVTITDAEGAKTFDVMNGARGASGADGKDYVLTDADKQEIAEAAAGLVDVPSVQPDWNQNDSTQPDYVKNRPFYMGDPVEMVMLPETTITITAGNQNLISSSFPYSFELGKTYVITFDGVDTEYTAYEAEGFVLIGYDYSSVAGGSGYVVINGNRAIALATLDTSLDGSHTIAIKGYTQEIIKIDEKYLPDNLATKSDVEAAQTTANNAKTTADDAKTTAYNAQTTANNAKTTANNAKTTANNAQTTANNAQTTANNAKTTANNAQTTANNAQTTANNAKSEALDLAARMFGHTSVVDNAFYRDETLSITSLPACIESIGDAAFARCTNLALTSLPSGLTSIGDQAFTRCANLALTSLPSGLTSIGAFVFAECTNLALTSLPSGLTSIGFHAFTYCTNLALTSLPSGLTSIGDQAFAYCTNLALTSLPSGLTSIGDAAFADCTNLALTSLPSGLTSIGDSMFLRCTNLALTSLPSGLTSIGYAAFADCTNLALTSLPSGITSIGNSAFQSCTRLTSITFTGKPTTISSSAFNQCTNLTTINVPWAEGEVANAPWGATNATINYNYTGA